VEFTRSVNIITISRDGNEDVAVDGVTDDGVLAARDEGEGDDDVCSIPHATLCGRLSAAPPLAAISTRIVNDCA